MGAVRSSDLPGQRRTFADAGIVSGVVGAAAPFVDGSLGVGAEGASHVDAAAFVDSGGGDRFRGLVVFPPSFQRGESVELVGPGATTTMCHTGDHKET